MSPPGRVSALVSCLSSTAMANAALAAAIRRRLSQSNKPPAPVTGAGFFASKNGAAN